MPKRITFSRGDENGADPIRVTVYYPDQTSDELLVAGDGRSTRLLEIGVVVRTKIEWDGNPETRCILDVTNAKPAEFNRKGRPDRLKHLVSKDFKVI